MTLPVFPFHPLLAQVRQLIDAASQRVAAAFNGQELFRMNNFSPQCGEKL